MGLISENKIHENVGGYGIEECIIDIKNKRCIEEGCNTHPTYNYEGKTKALYCKAHAKGKDIETLEEFTGKRKCY